MPSNCTGIWLSALALAWQHETVVQDCNYQQSATRAWHLLIQSPGLVALRKSLVLALLPHFHGALIISLIIIISTRVCSDA